ncbi:O-succinylhomoserine sulfhydrylase [Flaviflagellibacter deserti]|uniref:O-succinylhomoserine sulfhydrylase n=1 Tax=Flaviflagellibacter deserti TaxID=2267266 RepID=A0ABV9Z138_9HYPH
MSKKAPLPARKLKPATVAVHEGALRSQFNETAESIFLTQGYIYDSMEQAEARFNNTDPGFQYSRFSNPTVTMFENRMAALEGAEAARATATGMAAVTAAILSFVNAGEHIVAAKALFGSCRYIIEDLAPRFGITSTLVDGSDLDQWQEAVRPNTKAFFLETPTNPTLDIYDISAVAEIAHAAGAKLIIDNVFATPVFQKPLALGADVVCYSATKHIDGQGRTLGGIVLGTEEFVTGPLQMFLRQTGPSLSPFNAWVMLKGLETLALRVEKAAANAAKIADFLADHPKVTRAIYPFRPDHPHVALARKQMTAGSTLVTFDVRGGKAEAFRFGGALEIVKITNNLGDAKSLITHPATTTHQRLTPEARAELGIGDSMLRLSVGIEDADDLIEDISIALDAI